MDTIPKSKPPERERLGPVLVETPPSTAEVPGEPIGPHWVFFGSQGLRAGWSVLLFYLLYRLLFRVLGSIVVAFDPDLANFEFSVGMAIAGEMTGLLAVLGAMLVVARIEERSIRDYFLRDPLGKRRFLAGMLAGFLTLSALVAWLWAGGWLQMSASGMSETQIFGYAILWAFAFFLTGLLEEGAFRCFLLYTFARGVNFWWAFAIVSAVCMRLLMSDPGNSSWGVYLMALLGLIPCLILHHLRAQSAGFWQAAWVTSTLFGYWHTGNHGESQIGIFAAAAIGLVFCVSVRLTGSAWWAIGCHMAWDWAETYFYGTADSGNVTQSHLFFAQPAGNPLMSGGSVGPEGSVVALVIILLLLVAVVLLYRRKAPVSPLTDDALE
jgi:CAAX protease family protein